MLWWWLWLIFDNISNKLHKFHTWYNYNRVLIHPHVQTPVVHILDTNLVWTARENHKKYEHEEVHTIKAGSWSQDHRLMINENVTAYLIYIVSLPFLGSIVHKLFHLWRFFLVFTHKYYIWSWWLLLFCYYIVLRKKSIIVFCVQSKNDDFVRGLMFLLMPLACS